MVPAGARARVLVLSALAALPAGAGPAGLPKQPLPKLLAATDAAHAVSYTHLTLPTKA